MQDEQETGSIVPFEGRGFYVSNIFSAVPVDVVATILKFNTNGAFIGDTLSGNTYISVNYAAVLQPPVPEPASAADWSLRIFWGAGGASASASTTR